MTNQALKLSAHAAAAEGMKHMTKLPRALAALLLTAIAFASPPAAAGSANVQIQAHVPVVCEASIVGFHIVTIAPLIIDARVRQACNSTHELSVTYAPTNLTHPHLLFMALGGETPDAMTPGDVTFGNLQHTNSIKPLRIFYAGGTRHEREQLAHTIAIAVTPL